jgi:hypothetical protein
MNLKTTLVLLVLIAGGGVFWVERSWLGEHIGLTAGAPGTAHSDTLDVLREQFTPAKLSRIEIQVPNADRPVILERSGGVWTAPGQWPTRKNEVEQLVAMLCGLRSRFVPIPAEDDETRQKYGLDKPAVTVTVKAGPMEYHLALSEKAAPGEKESQEASRLNLPTFLRLDQRPEIVRLAPGLIAELSRSADYYQQRRLFTDVERVAKEVGDAQEKVEQLAATSLTIEEKKPAPSTVTLTKNGTEWELAQPVRDRLDPDKRKSLLQAVPDIWAEQFVAKPDKDLAKYGLKDPEQILRVVPAGSDKPIMLLIGSESPTKRTRTVTRPAPPVGGMQRPPMTERIDEKFRYAKLENNDQIFEIKADKLKDVFVPAADMRDARVARFETKDVTRIELTHGSETIALAKVKEKDTDRWRMGKPTAGDAESSKITEILDKLTLLSARDKDVLDKSDPKVDGLDKPQATLAVTVEEEIKGEDGAKTKKPPRTLKYTIGRHDTEKKKLYIRDDWNRVNVVDDNLQALLTRPATAYRGRRVLDFTAKDLDEIEIERQGQKAVALKQDKGSWKLMTPVAADADSGKAAGLARELGSLEVVEHVSDNPKPEDLDKQYGLAKPELTVHMKFAGDKAAETLLIGKQREGKQEYFAKRAAEPGVFVVKKDIHDTLDKDSLTYRPLQLWQVIGDDITGLGIQKEGQSAYTLTHKDRDWQITGPFEATALAASVQRMTDELAGPRGEKCVAHSAKDKELEKYGLDKPHLRVSVTTKDGKATKERTLLIGKTAEESPGARYAKLGDSDAVYIVPMKLLGAVDQGALDLLDRKLLAVTARDLAAVQSSAGGGTIRLERQDKGWKVADSPAGQPFPADDRSASAYVNFWSNLTAERFADYGPKVDAAKYGLDKPACTVTVTLSSPPDGKPGEPAKHTLTLGRPVENNGERYARLDNGPGVVVLSAATVKTLEETYLDFVDRGLLKFDAASATGLLRRTGQEALEVVKKDDAWRLLKPADLQADERTMQSLFEQLAALRAERVAAYPAKDVKTFGLDQPSASVTIRLAGPDGKPSEKVLKIGKPVDEKKEQGRPMDRFVQVEGSPVVGVLSGALADRLLAGPLAYRDRNLARFADADKAILKRGPREATFTKVDGTWKLTAPLEAEAEQTELDDFINGLARLRADELVADKPADLKPYGLDKPTAQWRFLSGDKEVLSLLIGSQPPAKNGGKDARTYAKLSNGDLVFLLDPPTTKRVLAEYRSKSLWPTSLDAAQVETLRYSGTGTGFTLEKAGDQWHVADKPSAQVNPAAVSDTLAALAGLKPERYVVDKGADMKLYGLEPPEVVMEAVAPTGRRTLHIGRAEGDSKRYYARVTEKDRTDVFVISESDAAKLVRQLAAFTQGTVKPAS